MCCLWSADRPDATYIHPYNSATYGATRPWQTTTCAYSLPRSELQACCNVPHPTAATYTKSRAPAWLPACTTTSSGERGSSPIVNSAGTCPVSSAMAQLIADSMKPNNSHHMSSDKFLSANKQRMAYSIVQCIRSVLPSV